MVLHHFSKNQANDNGDDLERLTDECKELLLSLPREKGWRTACLYKYKGFWCQPKEIQAIISFQKHFQPRDTDVILTSIPKSGTTWLKALSFAIMNRKKFAISSNDHPLLVSNPHDLAPFFEYKLYADKQVPDLSELPDPRLFATHIPFAYLPDSIKKSNCRIIYICRNPFDTFISSWTFSNKLRSETAPPLLLEETFKLFCEGVVGFGPFWDHMLGYWKESLERQDKVLFLKYEDMKADVTFYLKKIAKFLGCPFSMEEEKEGVVVLFSTDDETQGVIQEIETLCSLSNLKDLMVSTSGSYLQNHANTSLLRKGKAGDCANYLSSSTRHHLEREMQEKPSGFGLTWFILMTLSISRLSY
ncbi:cytosolic sulfotransferase 15-like [Populus alba x Populus x berolinensis]|nr:cytosolic sulfotransferase 15-like [Populus alba x Populus x berolinensis]